MSGEETANLEEIVKRLRRKKAQGDGIDHRHRSVGMSIAQATGILAQGDIPRVMEAIVKLLEARELELNLEREKIRLLNRFIGDASHDLRTPLTIMKTSLYLLRKKSIDPDWIDRLSTVDTQVEYIHRLVEDMISLSSLESSNLESPSQLVDINGLIAEVCDSVRIKVEENHHTFSYEPGPSLIHIPLRASDFSTALRQLLLNAINYTPPGGTITVNTCMRDWLCDD
jgi:signal transduction histidine kinase